MSNLESVIHSISSPLKSVGQVVAVRDGLIQASGLTTAVGDRLSVVSADGQECAQAEVISLGLGSVKALLLEQDQSIRSGAKVVSLLHNVPNNLDVDQALAIDAHGAVIELRSGAIKVGEINPQPYIPNLVERAAVERRIQTGSNAIDTCLPIGLGQRMGVFAEAGAGKSTLLREFLKNEQCDHIVVALIGERSREALETIRFAQTEKLDRRITFVVGLAGNAAPTRARVMDTSLAIAQHMAKQGRQVLHLVDSLTRYAFAVRETGILAGEPLAHSGMTPSVYQRLSESLEMSGAWTGGGSITTIGTVLLESALDDSISSYMRSLLDGHIYLDKEMADRGIFPAIDIVRSRSRLDSVLLNEAQQQFATQIRSDLIDYGKIEEYLKFSGYEAGTNAEIDQKVKRFGQIIEWIQNRMSSDALMDEPQ